MKSILLGATALLLLTACDGNLFTQTTAPYITTTAPVEGYPIALSYHYARAACETEARNWNLRNEIEAKVRFGRPGLFTQTCTANPAQWQLW